MKLGSYQPFHDQIGYGLTMTVQSCIIPEATSYQPFDNYISPAGLLSLFDQQADLLLPTTLFKGTSAKGEVHIKHT